MHHVHLCKPVCSLFQLCLGHSVSNRPHIPYCVDQAHHVKETKDSTLHSPSPPVFSIGASELGLSKAKAPPLEW